MSERWEDVQFWFFRHYMGFLDRRFRWFYRWHFAYGHPEWQPWPDEPDGVGWGPRHEWVCDLGDWLTMGWLHD